MIPTSDVAVIVEPTATFVSLPAPEPTDNAPVVEPTVERQPTEESSPLEPTVIAEIPSEVTEEPTTSLTVEPTRTRQPEPTGTAVPTNTAISPTPTPEIPQEPESASRSTLYLALVALSLLAAGFVWRSRNS